MSSFLGGRSGPLIRRRFPSVKVTGRCFLLRPRPPTKTPLPTNAQGSYANAQRVFECVELTQSGGDESAASREGRTMPGSLAGNDYYTQRYASANSASHRAATAASVSSSPRFLNGDLVLRLCLSAVPRELAHKRIVDVTGVQTSFFNSSERDRRVLATVEETLATMHLHDGHEVPALQRGDVDLMRLQPQCVYAPPSATPRRPGLHGTPNSATLDLTNLESFLCPLDNPSVLLAQARHLTFRSEVEALQVARVIAASVGALKGGPRSYNSSSPCGAVLRPVVRDGHVISVVLCFPRVTR